jgi:gluconolactonase
MNHFSRIGLGLLAALYPVMSQGTEFEAKDESSLKTLFPPTPRIERLATGMKFLEGPVWVAKEGGYLVFSDIPANELKRWTPTGGVALLRYPSRNANGNTVDSKGRLVTAEHSGRRISFTTKKDNVKALVNDYNGKKFNSPNDVVVKGDGTIWFTDPDYGLPKGESKELEGNFVFRCDDKGKSLEVVANDFDKPNGLCFSPDERRLYIADSGKPHHIRVFDVREDGTLANGKVFCVIDPGGPDGIRCDRDGRIWSSAGNGVQVFSPAGELLVRINLPEAAANLCFGGDDGTTLFVTARTSLYAVKTRVTGAPRPERESKK